MVSMKYLMVAAFGIALVESAPTHLDKRAPIYCETSGGSPYINDIRAMAGQFGRVASEYRLNGCTPIGYAVGTARFGICLWGTIRPPSAIDTQIMINQLASACNINGKAGGKIGLGNGAEFLIYHS